MAALGAALALLAGPFLGVVPAVAADTVVAPAADQLSVDGDLRVGGTATVDPRADLWQPTEGLTFSQQWYADGAPLAGEVDASLDLTAELEGATLSVDVTGTLPASGDTPESSDTVTVVAAGAVAPAPPGPASIVGTVQVGSTVTAEPGANWAEGTTFAYTWLVGGEVAGTGPSLALAPEYADLSLVLRVTGSVEGQDDVTAETDPVTVAKGTFVSGKPWISGVVRVGSKLTAKPGTWQPEGATFAYEWLVGTTVVGTGTTFTPLAVHKGKTLKVRVTATKAGYTSLTNASDAKSVAAGIFTAAPRPKISGLLEGRAKIGKTLTALPLATQWSPRPTTFRYQWKVDGRAISGATSSTYTPKARQHGKTLTVTVKGIRAGYTTKVVTSVGAVVSKPYANAPRPTISGTVRVGSFLTAKVGTWEPRPASFAYQWKANGKAIAGATGRTYRLKASDYRKRISVTVTAKKAAYLITTRTSAQTAGVKLPAPVITGAGLYKVGTDIKPGTYVAYVNGSYYCGWERRSNSGTGVKGRLGIDVGYGQRIVTIKSTDAYFRTAGCGSWHKFYPIGGVRTTTPPDGVWTVGTQLKPGLYRTEGPAYSDSFCYWSRLSAFTGAKNRSNIIAEGEPTGAATVRIRSTDKGFEAFGCSWRRIGD